MPEDSVSLGDNVEVPETPKRQRKGKVQETTSENTSVSKHMRQFKKAYLNMVKAWIAGGQVDNHEFVYHSVIVNAEWNMLTDDEQREVRNLQNF